MSIESFGTIKEKKEEERRKGEALTRPPKPPVLKAETAPERKKTVFEEIADMYEEARDKRENALPHDAQREAELVEAGCMSQREKLKLDEEIARGRGHSLGKWSFRNFFQFPGLIKGDWEIVADAERKIHKTESLAYLVEEGNLSREDYKDLLRLMAQNPEAAEARTKELYKAKCEELTDLVETPEFKAFLNTVVDSEWRGVFTKTYESAFDLYNTGRYDEALRELKGTLDSEFPWVSYGRTPIYRMFKMKGLGLVGDGEIQRVFGHESRTLSMPGDKELKAKFSHYGLLEELRGLGKITDEEFAKRVEAMKIKSPA